MQKIEDDLNRSKQQINLVSQSLEDQFEILRFREFFEEASKLLDNNLES